MKQTDESFFIILQAVLKAVLNQKQDSVSENWSKQKVMSSDWTTVSIWGT